MIDETQEPQAEPQPAVAVEDQPRPAPEPEPAAEAPPEAAPTTNDPIDPIDPVQEPEPPPARPAKRRKRLTRTAYDSPHVKAVTATALLWEGEHAGNIVIVRHDSPDSLTNWIATIDIWGGPVEVRFASGRSRESAPAAMLDALNRTRGGYAEKIFDESGYTTVQVLG